MNYGRLGTAFAGMFSAGALTMYLFDPQRGRTRRVVLKDALAHSRHELGKFAGRFGRDFGHRVEGAVAETENLFHREQASDYVLEQRVRSVIGRTVSHPHAINVSCKDGCVTLSGWIMANEGEDLDKAVESIKGVAEVSTFLNTTNHPEHISDLQGGTPRKRLPEYLRQSWSPTARVAAGGFGISLLAYGFTRRQPGIGSCVVCPGEVATPILDKRPIPITPAERKRMAQSEDVGDLIRYVACLPPHIVINEVMINPTWNRRYVADLQRGKA